MIITTTDSIPNKMVAEIKGIARGNTVRARHIGSDITAGLKNIVGGEVRSYVKLLGEAREESLQRMKKHAEEMGADAVINVRFITAQIMQGSAELLAYGTAVKLAN